MLKAIDIPFKVNDKIVRGLDYYNKTVFEFMTDHLGAQNTIGGGGRYDGLLKTFGGTDLPSVGFGTGLERVLQVVLSQKIDLPKKDALQVYFIPMGDKAREVCFSLLSNLRHHRIAADGEWNARKMQTALQNAVKSGATYAAIIGNDELEKNVVQIKHLELREQQEVSFDKLIGFFE